MAAEVPPAPPRPEMPPRPPVPPGPPEMLVSALEERTLELEEER